MPESGTPDTGVDGSDPGEIDTGILPAEGFLQCGVDWCNVGAGETCCTNGATTECADSTDAANACEDSLACDGPENCAGSQNCCSVGFSGNAIDGTECGSCNIADRFECSGSHNCPGSEVCCGILDPIAQYPYFGITHSQCKAGCDPTPTAEIRLCSDGDDCDCQPSATVSGFMVCD